MQLNDHVILVDSDDNEQGTMEKVEAHKKGKLHRAFSIFVLNSKNEILLQKRSEIKYHSAGKWTNTCCSHPRYSETLEGAAHRRLKEEMGFDCELEFKFSFLYKTELDNNLIEHELDHVFIGHYDNKPKINILEASDWRFVSIQKIEKEIEMNPRDFSVWFLLAFVQLKKYIQ